MADLKPLAPRPLSPLQRRLLPLADGTRTYREMADLADATVGSVNAALVIMRAGGYPVSGLSKKVSRSRQVRHNKVEMTRMEFDKMVAQREQGLTWREIGESLGLKSGSVANGRAQRFAKLVGVELPRKRARGQGRIPRKLSYVKLRELRVEAGLPWHMIAQAMGCSCTKVAKDFKKLQAIHEPAAVAQW